MTSEETKDTHSNKKLGGGSDKGMCACVHNSFSLSLSTLRITTDIVTVQMVVNSDMRNVGNT